MDDEEGQPHGLVVRLRTAHRQEYFIAMLLPRVAYVSPMKIAPTVDQKALYLATAQCTVAEQLFAPPHVRLRVPVDEGRWKLVRN